MHNLSFTNLHGILHLLTTHEKIMIHAVSPNILHLGR